MTVAVTFSQMARAKLRRPTSVASVATKGGRPITVISQACRLPIRSPTTIVPTIAIATMGKSIETSRLWICSGARIKSKVAQIVPLKQITEPDDKSIPPAIMTIADPSEKIPRNEVCRAISTQLVHGFFT